MKKYLLLALVMMCGACSPRTGEQVSGTYMATYPFGTDTITLTRDGTFVQQLAVTGDTVPATARGNWRFDPGSGYVMFDKILSLDDGFGRLNPKWRTPKRNAALPVEWMIFQTIMGSGAEYPYSKQ